MSVRIARRRWRGGAVPGSVRRQISWSSVGMLKVTPTLARTRGRRQDVDVADDQRAARDQAERRPRLSERDDGAARQPEPTLGRLVRVGGRPDGDLLATPRAPASSRVSTSTRLVLTRIDVP